MRILCIFSMHIIMIILATNLISEYKLDYIVSKS